MHSRRLVRRKAAGKPIKVAEREEKPDNVVNLMDALKASLKGKSAAKGGRRSSDTASAGTTGGQEGAQVSRQAPQGGVSASLRHCERSEANPDSCRYWIASSLLLTMTRLLTCADIYASTSSRSFSSSVFRFFDAFFGTFLPLALASDRPIAIACLRLLRPFWPRTAAL